jgi:hypothetical protein
MDANKIKELLQIYFDVGYDGDGEGMRRVFHDAAHLYLRGEDGELVDWDLDTFVGIVSSNPPGASENGYPRYDEVISIDFTGEHTAVARVKVRVQDTLYTDILSFLRLGDKWGIIAKVPAGVSV